MTAQELLRKQVDDVGEMLERAFEGLPTDAREQRASPDGMSPRQMLFHLCEVYHAFAEEAAGRSHEWGTFTVDDESWDGLRKRFLETRVQAAEIAVAGDAPKLLDDGTGFLVVHDSYHLGQLCLARMQADPQWNAYSIYGM